MSEIDTVDSIDYEHDSEHSLLMGHVVVEDHELLYLDTYLKELFE